MSLSKFFTRVCWELGYTVKRRKEELIPFPGRDPRGIPYLKKLPFTLMELPTALGVGLRFYPLSTNSHHPFILALDKNDSEEELKKHAFEVLKKYSELVNIKNANDFLGLSGGDRIFPEESHPYEFTFPWSPLSPVEMKNNYRSYFLEENRKYSLDSDECLESTYVSDKKIQLEVSRLVKLFLSIKNKGYVPNETEPIGGAVFVKGKEWKWIVEGGQHRAAVVAALGMEKVPVYVKRIIRREDVYVWPGVQKRIFCPERALRLFDHMFDLKSPGSAKDWVQHVNENMRKEFFLEESKLNSYEI